MSSIQRLGLIVKALLPASAKRGSNSTPLKSGLFSFSHKPRYSNVFFTNGCKNTHLPPNRQAYHSLFLLNLLTLNLSKNACHFLFFFFVRHRPLRKGRYTYYYRAYPELDAAVRDGWGYNASYSISALPDTGFTGSQSTTVEVTVSPVRFTVI